MPGQGLLPVGEPTFAMAFPGIVADSLQPQDFPIASNYSERVISLPLYPKMSSADVERVIGTVKNLIKKFRR